MARLFLALWPDPATRAALAAAAAGLVVRGGRPTPAADLHATLVFLGELGAPEQARLEAALEDLRGAPFALEIDHAGYWRQPRVCWLAPSTTPAALAALVEDLRGVCDAAGIPFDRRPFRCHVTIARRASGLEPPSAPILVRWPVAGFALVRSAAGPAAGRYTPLREWPLRAGARGETALPPVR